MVLGLVIAARSNRSNDKKGSSWRRALSAKTSTALSFHDIRQDNHASSSQVVGWANLENLDRPQHVECIEHISSARRHYHEAVQQIDPLISSNTSDELRLNEEFFQPHLPDDLLHAIEREHEELIPYKGRYLKGRPLHFAIWVASLNSLSPLGMDGLEDVKILLWAKAEPNSSATYTRRKEVVELPALHIAAGLGCIAAMEMILDYVDSPSDEINRFCFCGDREFYCALHDAVFNGKAKAAIWLLEQHADPSVKNMEGYTALHWLALRSMDEDSDVEEVVRSLIRSRASVEQSTEEGKIPLEMAVKPGSLFPKHLLYLLAPSYQALDGAQVRLHNCSFFEDLALMSSHSGKAAQDFADRIATLPVAVAKHKAIADAQHENAVDCMASLLQMAPEAAAVMLGLLLELEARPIQENPGHHSLSSRAILWGRTLQCAYKPDQRMTRLGPRQNLVRWPEWKYDATLGHAPTWHGKLLQAPQEHQARSSKVFDVETLVLLLPNILDIDICMALASTRSVHRQIFNSLPVKAAVHCLWMELISTVFGLTLIFNFMDLLIFACWGLTPAGRPLLWRLTSSNNQDIGTNSSLQFPRFANFLLAGLLRDLVNISWWLYSLCWKWLRHKKNVTIAGTLGRGHELRSGLHSLWHPAKMFDLSHNTNMPELILILLKAVFLLSVQCVQGCDRAMSHWTQALLAVCFFMHSVKLIYMLRVSAFGGKKILVLLKTLVSGAMREMFLVAFLFFLAFVVTAVMLDRKGAISVVSWSLYRGLIFGDGAGLDNMGFAIEGSWRGESGFIEDIDVLQWLLTIMAILGTVTFIVILNMIIAIYSNEYGRLETESDLLFQRERAKYCCNCLLGMQKLRSRSCCFRYLVAAAVIFCTVGSILLFILFPSNDPNVAPPPPLAAFLLAVSQVGMQALMMHSDWFAVGRSGEEGPRQEHFLWTVRRCEQRDLQAEQKQRRMETEAEANAKLQELMSEIRDHLAAQAAPAPSKAVSSAYMSKRNTDECRPITTGGTPRAPGTPHARLPTPSLTPRKSKERHQRTLRDVIEGRRLSL